MLILPVELCHFCFGCYGSLVIESVAYTGEESSVPENLRISCKQLR